MNHRSPRSLIGRAVAALALAGVVGGAVPGVAGAAEAASEWFATEQGRVRLIAAEPSIGAVDTARLGLEFRLAPHWKVYWRSPGDAGYPPHLDWAGSRNLAGASLAWPAPRRFSVSGLDTMGYEDAVVLPITARLEHPGEPLHIEAALQYLTCEQICIPYETTLVLDLPAGAAPPGASGFADLIQRFEAAVPGDGKSAGLALESAVIETGAAPTLVLRLAADPPLAHPDAFVEGPAGIGFGAPVLARGDPDHPALRVAVLGDAKDVAALAGQPLTVTIVDGTRALESTVSAGESAPGDPLARLLPMLLVALLGGLILNVMPCVLPVLSIKLLGAVKHSSRGQRAVRRGFLASAAGILLSFLALAAAMIALRQAGVAVGWGLQFQQPLFLAAIVALLTLFAANLWDFFEIPLPRVIADRLGGRQGEGGILGDLAAGAFATVLATPCSAPFLGTAIGFALAGSSLDILAIFLALGLGLALPYLAVAALPDLARLLPRPGAWMIVLRRLLGLALIGTAVWLVVVLSAEIGLGGALAIAGAMAALWILLAVPRGSPLQGIGAAGLILLALVAAGAAPGPATRGPTVASDALWQPFDRGRIADLVSDGKVVFVDVTADWCLTCQVNKRLVLDRGPVRDGLAAPGVVAMQADWTRPDPAIADYLRGYGRYGIPFNAVYGPGAPSGIALSELLSPGAVIEALDRARAVPPSGSAAKAAGAPTEIPRHGG